MRLFCSVESFCRLLGGSTLGGMRPRLDRLLWVLFRGAGTPFLGGWR